MVPLIINPITARVPPKGTYDKDQKRKNIMLFVVILALPFLCAQKCDFETWPGCFSIEYTACWESAKSVSNPQVQGHAD